jgi:hypothetical protein
MDKEQLIDELQNVLIGMDVPNQRKKDIGWLNRNLAINNQDHPNFLKAVWILKQLNKEK